MSDYTSEELKRLWQEEMNPPVRPMCSRVNLMDSGNRMVHVFPFYDSREDYVPAAAISVFRMSFTPDKPEDLNMLNAHVRKAVQGLASIKSEFFQHNDYVPEEKRYKRPSFYAPHSEMLQGIVQNAYVYPDNGEVIVAAPLILSDAIHVYNQLKGVVIPSEETALQFEQARWNELRGPVSSSDARQSILERDYSFEAMPMDQQLGCLHNTPADNTVSEALRHMIAMRTADISTDEELALQLTGLSYSTVTGLLEDKSGRYPALPAPHTGRSLQQIADDEKATVAQRAGDMLRSALGRTDAAEDSNIQETLHQLHDSFGAAVQEKLDDPHYNPYQRHMEADWDDTRVARWTDRTDFKAKWQKSIEQIAADDEARKGALSESTDTNFRAQEIPFFLPRRHVWKNIHWSGDVIGEATYQSRPPGPAWPPLLDLPENLAPLLKNKREQAPAQAMQPVLGWKPA